VFAPRNAPTMPRGGANGPEADPPRAAHEVEHREVGGLRRQGFLRPHRSMTDGGKHAFIRSGLMCADGPSARPGKSKVGEHSIPILDQAGDLPLGRLPARAPVSILKRSSVSATGSWGLRARRIMGPGARKLRKVHFPGRLFIATVLLQDRNLCCTAATLPLF
jgi:hypothetical protein